MNEASKVDSASRSYFIQLSRTKGNRLLKQKRLSRLVADKMP